MFLKGGGRHVESVPIYAPPMTVCISPAADILKLKFVRLCASHATAEKALLVLELFIGYPAGCELAAMQPLIITRKSDKNECIVLIKIT